MMSLFKRRKRPQMVGLDIGSSFVKAVELRPVGNDYELVGFGMAPVPPGALEGGEIKQAAAVQQAIRQAIDQGRIQATDAAIGMSGGSVIAKRVTLPKMSEAELAESIRWEAEQHIPFDIEDVELDFQVLRQDGPQQEVMLVAVKKGKVRSYADVVAEAGLNVAVVDVDVFALETQYEHNFQGENEVVALVNIGHETTNTNILQGGVNVYARDVFVGGKQYSATLAQRFDLAPQDADALVRGKQGQVSWAEIEPVLDLVSQELGQEIQRTLDYFGTTAEHERIQRIFLSGGCALVPGLKDFLSSQWGIEVASADPFKRVKIGSGLNADVVQKLAPLAAVSTGLAMRYPDDRK
ncbi:MAG TPA: type IV pilus assembly protein PilM [Methylomirabilota bacterium]|jgi:type IV pilus assembly protein PilM|nr:type IV pilus assembly protein PilM [Methylomirabilota bacterium]